HDYIKILIRGRWIIVFSFLIVVLITAYFTFTTPPVYEATGLVLLKEEGAVRRQLFEVASLMQQETRINNQVEILKSDTLAKEVIKRLMESPMADSLWILGRRKRTERFPIKQKIVSMLPIRMTSSKNKTDSLSTADLAESFRRAAITVIPKRSTDLIEMRARASSPFEAAYIVNTWIEAYKSMDISESQGEVKAVRQFLEAKLQDVQTTLSGSENQLKEYKEQNKVTELSSETEQLIRQSAEFETMYQEARTELGANQKRLEYIEGQLDQSQRALLDETTSVNSPVIQELQRQMALLIADKAAYEQQLRGAGYSTTNDSKLKTYEQRLKGMQESIQAEIKKLVSGGGTVGFNPMAMSETLLNSVIQITTENVSLMAKTQALGQIVQQFNRIMNKLPEKTLRLAQLQREAQVNNTIFMMLREKFEENRIAEAGQIGSVRIVDRAKPPKSPIKPKKKMNMLLSMLVGLGLGIGMTFIREYMDTSLKTIEDVERLGFPVLGSIPFITSTRISRHMRTKSGELLKIESRLITHFAPKSPISEAYRTLRTNIQYARADRHVKTVLVTSSGMGEGKSTSVANLAITFAQMGAKTLLIDTDLRRPILHGIFNYSRNEGLTNVLLGRLNLDEALKTTKMENLSLITSGILPPNPSELLASQAMEKFIGDLSSRFDIILFDTPPVIAVTDAAVLATKLDGCILVVRSGKTSQDALLRSKVLLDNVKANVLGVLVNGVNVERIYGSYYYYYYAGEGKEKSA
ncbi:MAG TPA: polysaccharide biosynthesis tyrosine autokinase, partial [bacterium]